MITQQLRVSLTPRQSFALIIAITFVLKLALAICTYGTNDVRFFEAYADKVKRDGGMALYVEGATLRKSDGSAHQEPFWHPPLIINLLSLWALISSVTGLSFQLVFRLFSILADVGSSLIVWYLLEAWSSKENLWTASVFVASPLVIFLSGFHGNTDAIMVFFLLLSVWSVESGKPAWLSGMAFGASISVKFWPFLLLPVMALYLPSWRVRLKFCLAVTATFLVAGLPYLAQHPMFVLGKVTEYKSLYGHWGLSRVIPWLSSTSLNSFFFEYGRALIIGICFAVALWMHFGSKARLTTRIGVVCALFLSLTPGFGIQYLGWLLPWLVVLGWEFILLYSVATGFFMGLVYTWWSGGFPWYFADSLVTGTWQGSLVWYELLCWLVTLYICAQLLRNAGLGLRLSGARVPQGQESKEHKATIHSTNDRVKRRKSRVRSTRK